MNKYMLEYKLNNVLPGIQNMPAETEEEAKQGALEHIADRELVEVDEINAASVKVTYAGEWQRNKKVECEGCT
jgi:hypothetical protein